MRKVLDRITLADLLQSEGGLAELLRTRLAEAVMQSEIALLPVIPQITTPSKPEMVER
jgi:hypothetical protein